MLEVSAPYPRTVVTNSKHYRMIIRQWNGKKKLFRTVYHFNKHDFSDIIIDQVFLDLDKCDKSYPEVLKLCGDLIKDHIRFRVNFSGRGFHVYVATEHQNIDRKSYLKLLFSHIINKYGLTSVDPITIGNIKQMRRIENTVNIKNGLYCIPLKYEELQSLDGIKELAKQPRDFDVWWIDGDKIKLEPITLDIHKVDAISGNGEFKEIDDIIPDPCMARILHLSHPGHDERFLLCQWLSYHFRGGKDIRDFNLTELSEKIIAFMRTRNWDDFSEAPNTAKSTRYQVVNIINKKYNNISNCKWRRMHGICNSDFCWESKHINSNKA